MEYKDLIGKTISNITKMKSKKYDDKGYLKIDFDDGTTVTIVATYGHWSGESSGEYPTDIGIHNGDLKYIEEIK